MPISLSIPSDAPPRSRRLRAQVPSVRWAPASALEAKDGGSWNSAEAFRWLRTTTIDARSGAEETSLE
eukprot:3257658-Pyramimonas_sp.AAC.1